jgi:hypothetical protein
LLSLQDDSAQIIDLPKGIFVNLVGHHSFVSQTAIIENNTALLSSFDGTISLTTLPKSQEWNTISKRDKSLYTLKANSKEWTVNEKF